MNASDDHPPRQIEIIDRLRSQLQAAPAKGRRTPITTLTYAQSIDGSIAPWGGGTLQLSNPESQQLTHEIRALHDAILVGINTVLFDDPQLTVRLATGANPQPVVVDSRLRFPMHARLLRDPCRRPIIATGKGACEQRAAELRAQGARILRVPQQENGLIDLPQLLPILKDLGLHSVMVEGGAKVITSVLSSEIADQLLLAIAPRFVGGLRAVNPTQAWERLPELRDVQYQHMSGDLIVWGYLVRNNGSTTPGSSKSNTGTRPLH